ncbi:MAG: VPLPA-CTERM sorting domain-containing protein [Pseudomonadota bacterium]
MLKNLAAVSAALLISTGAASAATMFSDDFSTYGSTTVLNAPDSLFGGNWSTTDGTIDYLAEGDSFGDLCQGTGNCIDLDGSTGNSGVFSSIVFDAGTYTLDIGLLGSGRGTTESVTITLGDWTTTISGIGSADDASTSFTFATTGGALSFENAGGDNRGAILTSVDLAPVPLPAGGLLLLAGLGGLAMVRRKKA